MHDPIREQLESLTSMVYDLSIYKEDKNRPFKPQIHQMKRRGQNRQNFGDRDRNRSVKVQNVFWYMILCYFLDNSDSPSIAEQ